MDYYGPLTGERLSHNQFSPRFDAGALLTLRVSYDGGGVTEYLGLAAPGTEEAAAGWMIRKLVYDGEGKFEALLFADGNALFDNAWDDRATLTYL